jgi:ribosomal protein S18 acetylase RimI-like enzyme
MNMRVREYEGADHDQMVRLVSAFRMSVDALRGFRHEVDVDTASQEFEDYLKAGFRTFVAQDDGGSLAGFIVCKVVDGVVWAESIYVDPPSRRGGVGSMLFEKANELARGNKHDTAYAWVHPNNDVVISFLKRHGYDVLNLVEVRRAHEDERLDQTVTLMRNSFRY